ncbi:acyl-CoA synthetase [Iodidimonas sp. SYSU 1G8]|uniref:acyl-CoA synthetase n=1 Tax=Iodidimonas sp. SYSU 1G8 TaxID=3133967 RepID=UPI0031FE6DE5
MTAIFSGDRTRSHEDLMQRALRAGTGFQAMGVGPDSGVAVMLRNDFTFFEASRGATFAGAYAVPINWHFKGDEVRYILEDSQARALVVHADLLPQVEGFVPDGVETIVVATPEEVAAAYGVTPDRALVPAGMTCWEQWLSGLEPHAAPSSASRGAMFYTSGTTGRPKGVKRGVVDIQQVMGLMIRTASEAWGFSGPHHRILVTGPMYHSAPSGYASAAAGMGAYTVLQPRFDAEDFLRQVERHRITHAVMVPTMFVRLLALPDDVKKRYDISSLEWITHGAAPCAPDVKRQMIEWFGPVINEYFGGTEIGLITTANSDDALRKPGTVGKAITGAKIRIFDEDGKALGPGEIGEVYVWMEGMPDFTYHGLDAKREEIGRDNLVCIGDIGYLDEDGYLFLCDRKIEMVISGGVNIYPAEIEATLIGMPGVRDCAVFGIPDPEFGEALCAYVEPEDGASLDIGTIKAFLRERLAGYKVPRVVEFASELPREDSGKIFKRKLKEPYWAGMDRRI